MKALETGQLSSDSIPAITLDTGINWDRLAIVNPDLASGEEKKDLPCPSFPKCLGSPAEAKDGLGAA